MLQATDFRGLLLGAVSVDIRKTAWPVQTKLRECLTGRTWPM